MGIRVGYEPVGVIGPAALAAGQGQYKKFLDEMQQRERMQQAELAARQASQYASLQAQREDRQAQLEFQRERARQSDELARLQFDRQLAKDIDEQKYRSGRDSVLDERYQGEFDYRRSNDDQKKAALEALGFAPGTPESIAGMGYGDRIRTDREDRIKGGQAAGLGAGLQGLYPDQMVEPGFEGPKSVEQGQFEESYSPSQQAAIKKIQADAQRIMSNQDLNADGKLAALQQLVEAKKNIVPMQPPRVTTLPDGTDVIDVGGKITVQPPSREPKPVDQAKRLDMMKKAKEILTTSEWDADSERMIKRPPSLEEINAFVDRQMGVEPKPPTGSPGLWDSLMGAVGLREQPPFMASAAEAAKLPPGTVFMSPKGLMRVPGGQ